MRKSAWGWVTGLSLAVAACGGGGGGEQLGGGAAGEPAAGVPGGGVVALPGGGGGGGGPAPVQPPPAPVLTAPAPILASTCAHTPGAGREFNVGGPAGTPNRVDQIQEIPWEGLVPGDTVRIHWQAQPYAARLPLLRSGTAAHPIRVCGVLGGATGDQRPRITGRQAVTRQAPALQNGKQADLAAYGIVTITGNSFESRVEHVIVEGLRIGDTKNGDGTNSGADNAAFINANGQPAQYVTAAACIRMRQAAHITIRNNEIDNCGDGIFAGSLADNENHIVRHLLVEGNYLHGNAIIGNESRHQAYLQGVDITVQSNYFGQVRTNGSGVASGNQLKTRAAGLVVRYNYFLNGARSLDMVEAEEHSWMILPWKYQRHRARYLACQQNGCLKLNAQELAEYDARHVQDWAKYQAAYVYGNLFHVRGRSDAGARLPTNLVHYGYDNVQHDRQAGTAWFFHNTVLWESDLDDESVVRLFDYSGSDFGDGGVYGLPPTLKNLNGMLHYLTQGVNGPACQSMQAGCIDWGPMWQASEADWGRMRAFNNALVLRPFSAGGTRSRFELTRYLSDRLEVAGPMWISSGWTAGVSWEGGGLPHDMIDAVNVYPGGNANHHVTGLGSMLEGAPNALPIDTGTFAPAPGGPLQANAGAWPAGLPESWKPQFSVTRDPAQPGRLILAPRNALTTIGAVE